MDNVTSLIFSFINFLILCALFYWLVGSSANQFFYSRRARIRKQMLTSVMTLRQARVRAARSKERYEGLPDDIAVRKAAISRNCERECKQIIDEAHQKAEHMLKAGERRALEERKRYASLLRTRLMRSAFRIAEGRIQKGAGPKMQRKHLERGFEELAQVKSASVGTAVAHERMGSVGEEG